MGCVFGYIGKQDPGLLDRMATSLSHRSKRGTMRRKRQMSAERVFEIGICLPYWQSDQRKLFANEEIAFGYSGVLTKGSDFINSLTEHSSRLAPDYVLPDVNTRIRKDSPLEGAFALAVNQGDELTLVRDHAGAKVLYWTKHEDRLVFAGEIKALFADPNVPKTLRLQSIPEYLTFSFVPGEHTMFEGIFELQPGHMLTYGHRRIAVHRYFNFEDAEANGDNKDFVEYASALRSELDQTLRSYMPLFDGPPAVFLSGGIDSSSVLALTSGHYQKDPISSYSIHFGSEYASENEFISQMVERYRTRHHWIEIRPQDFLADLEEIFWCLDDPIGDPITVPNYIMARTASREHSVVLNGEGGDPCLGGPKNIPMILGRFYGPLDSYGNWIERDYLYSFKRCYDDLDQILASRYFEGIDTQQNLYGIVTPYVTAKKPQAFLNKLMAMNIRCKGANLILVKVDKMTSSNGLLALSPLFSKGIIEHAMMCPPRYKLMGSVEKAVLKAAVSHIVPQSIIERPKSGMMVPVKFWFRGEMYKYANHLLSKRNLRKLGFLNADYVRSLLKYEQNDGHGVRHGVKLWMLLTLVWWYKLMFKE